MSEEPIDALGIAAELLARAQADGDPRWAEKVLAVLEPASASAATDRDSLVAVRSMQAMAWHFLAEQVGRPEALDAAVEAFRLALAGVARADRRWPACASNLANALIDSSLAGADAARLDEAISLLSSCRAESAADDPNRPAYLLNLGRALLERARLRDDRESGQDAVAVLREAVAAVPHEDAMLLSNLGAALAEQADRTGDADLVVQAAAFQERAVGATAPGQPDRHVYLSNLGNTRLHLFELTSDETTLRQAIAAQRAAVAELAADNPDLERCLSNLANALIRLHEFAADDAALHEALGTLHRAVELSSPGSMRRAFCLLNLGTALSTAFTRWSDPRYLHEAIGALREALSTLPDGHRESAKVRSALGEALTRRFELSGEAAELDEAIGELRAAVEATPPQDASYAMRLSNLAGALMRRFERVRHRASLDEATAIARRALELTPPEHVALGLRLSGLGSLLAARYIHAGDPDDLHGAVAAHRAAVGATERGRPWRAIRLSGLGVVLLRAWQAGGERAALDEAITALGGALDAAGPDHAGRAGFCSNLANALRQRYELDGNADDADAAIRLLYEAADRADPRNPDHAAFQFNLGAVHRTRYRRGGDPAAAREAAEAFLAAAGARTAPVMVRATAAINAGRIAAEIGATALADRGFSSAVGMLDRLAWYGLPREDQEELLRRFGGVASDAAAWALEAADPERAVELLEHGRGVLLAQVMNARAPHAVLREAAPQLADRLERLDAELERGAATLLGEGAVTHEASGTAAERRMALAMERDSLLDQITAAGLGESFGTVGIDALRRAADDGPVILVNVSRYRCDGLAVTADGIRLTRLATTAEEATRHAVAFIDAVDAVDTADAVDAADESAGARPDPVEAVMVWLFEKIAEPVLRDLRLTDPRPPQDAPRVWWCPTGLLSFLPLHAAHPRRTADQSGSDGYVSGVLDRVASSYTPTLRALINARTRQAEKSVPPRALIVSLPRAPGQAPLPGAKREREKAQRQLPGAVVLRDGDATVAAVLDLLVSAQWSHLACHGQQDPTAPSEGCLWLSDGPLTVRAVLGRRVAQGQLAVLSACETVRGGAQLADEGITLASAVQLAGFRHVVGSLWAARDAIAARFVDVFYRDLAANGFDPDRSARSLHLASWRLRERHADAVIWSPFVHVGP